MTNRLYILFTLFCLLFNAISIKASSILFHSTNKIDISNNAILSMYQDEYGYLWIGTYDGLNLYNGKDTYVYRFELNNKSSLCSNIIHKITPACKDYLWISTSLGLNKFSLKERKVTESYPGYKECELMVANNSDIALTVCKENRISYYNPKLRNFEDREYNGVDPISVKVIYSRENNFYMMTSSGKIKKLTPRFSGTEINFTSEEITFHDYEIMSAYIDGNNIYFIDSTGQLYSYNITTHKKTSFSNLQAPIKKYGNIQQVLSFKDSLFVAFRNGHILNLGDSTEIESVDIGLFVLMKDRYQDIIWLGTDGQGVKMCYEKPNLFGSVQSGNTGLNVKNPIRSIFTDKYGSLWFGTKGDGIVRIKNYDSYNGKMIPYEKINHFTTANGLTSNRVYSFCQSRYSSIIWIETEDPGLAYYMQDDDVIKKMTTRSHDLPIRYIHSIFELNDSILWLGSTGDGLLEVVLDKKDPKEIKIKQQHRYRILNEGNICNELQSMIYDGDSTLILGWRGGYGITRFNIYTKAYDFPSINNSENLAIGDVLSVYKAEDSTFYIGASSGFSKVKFSEKEMQLRQFDKNDGMPNDMIHGILQDVNGFMWLSTNKGLLKYNPHNNFFHNYQQSNFEVLEYSDDAYWKCPYSNRLFFGGINGIVWVNPEKEIRNPYNPPLNFFEIQLDKQVIPLNPESIRKGISIPSSTQSVTISFVTPDHIDGANYAYAYKLDKYNSEWVELQNNNKITFTNIPHGDYNLKVIYRNDVYDSYAKEYTLPLRVVPPFYLSRYAILFYIVSGLFFLLLFLYMSRLRRLKKEKQIKEQIQQEEKEKLYEAKINFFTHITHELCTPLTLITGVEHNINEYFKGHPDSSINKSVSVLKENVEELNDLIQSILDFRKAEDTGFDTPVIGLCNVSELIETIYEWFTPLSEQYNVDFKVNIIEETYWNTDANFLKKIMMNLISNAFKYTPEGGEIIISLLLEGDRLILKVYNTGEGIKKEDEEYIFDRYQLLENNAKPHVLRTGLGLFICNKLVQILDGEIKIRSEVGHFAEFIVSLPKKKSENIKQKNETVVRNEDYDDRLLPDDISVDKPTVLVIDDHKDIVWLISETLSKDFNVEKAYSAEEAFQKLNYHTPSIIITDIMMPKMNGLEFIEEIRKNKFLRNIPIIIISAKISEAQQTEGINSGADAYLTKPFSNSLLLSMVHRLISKHKELKEYFYSPESAFVCAEGQLIHQEDQEFMDMVSEIIKDNIENDELGPEMIAELLHMNSRALYRRFKKISDTTPIEFIKNYRLSYSAQLLLTTTYSIQEIIYKIGISNKSYFYREFGKKYGMTPKEYRFNT